MTPDSQYHRRIRRFFRVSRISSTMSASRHCVQRTSSMGFWCESPDHECVRRLTVSFEDFGPVTTSRKGRIPLHLKKSALIIRICPLLLRFCSLSMIQRHRVVTYIRIAVVRWAFTLMDTDVQVQCGRLPCRVFSCIVNCCWLTEGMGWNGWGFSFRMEMISNCHEISGNVWDSFVVWITSYPVSLLSKCDPCWRRVRSPGVLQRCDPEDNTNYDEIHHSHLPGVETRNTFSMSSFRMQPTSSTRIAAGPVADSKILMSSHILSSCNSFQDLRDDQDVSLLIATQRQWESCVPVFEDCLLEWTWREVIVSSVTRAGRKGVNSRVFWKWMWRYDCGKRK